MTYSGDVLSFHIIIQREAVQGRQDGQTILNRRLPLLGPRGLLHLPPVGKTKGPTRTHTSPGESDSEVAPITLTHLTVKNPVIRAHQAIVEAGKYSQSLAGQLLPREHSGCSFKSRERDEGGQVGPSTWKAVSNLKELKVYLEDRQTHNYSIKQVLPCVYLTPGIVLSIISCHPEMTPLLCIFYR